MKQLARYGLILITLLSCTAAAADITSAPSARYALAAPAARYTLEVAGVDRAAELAADAKQPKAAPLRYAARRATTQIAQTPARTLGGEWRELADGVDVWRIPVHSAGALSLDFSFRRFFLPPGAQLYVRGTAQTLGPYTDADNPRSRVFATPLVQGDSATIEVFLPHAMRPFLELDLDEVRAGYRDIVSGKSFLDPNTGSGSCNIDTVCPQGDPWRSDVNAVAVVASDGVYCSGQLVNSTANDQTPLLLTANHCFGSQASGDSMIVYWKYESLTCRTPSSGDNALPVSNASAIAQTGGATLLAAHAASDTSLFRLNTPPPQNANVYFNGWDRTDVPFGNAAAIHHPDADAKRISLTAGSVIPDDKDYGQNLVPGINHWRVDHYAAGTTEAGSSGGGLIDAAHHLRGVLSGGNADCATPDGYDEYGRISVAWQGGGTPATRVSDWLDPHGTGATQIDGQSACSLAVTLTSSADSALVGDKILLTAGASGGVPPYRYAFDVDGDGVADTTDPSQSTTPVVYPGAFAGNVSVAVTDSAGCNGSATRALVVQAPKIVQVFAPVAAPQALCGGNPNGAIEPGQRWRQIFVLGNNGNTASQAGWAIFAQDPTTLAQTKLTLETPAVALPALAPGQNAIVALDYAIDSTNACSAPIKIDLVGALDARGYSAIGTAALSRTIDSACQAVTTCPAVTAPLSLTPGAYYDNLRPGTGMTLVTVPQPLDPLLFGVWFVGDSAREPTWYTVQAPLHANQANSPLYRTQQTQPPSWPQGTTSIGSAQVTVVDANRFAYTWNFGGHSGGSLYQLVTTLPSSIRIWYNPAESGWGTYDQLVQVAAPTAAPLIATFLYFYDAAGTPRWAEGSNSSYVAGASEDVTVLRPACPSCVWLDYGAGQQSVGTMQYGGSTGAVQISTNILLPAPIAGPWLRNALPLTPLYLSP
jgi:hypothetical protein